MNIECGLKATELCSRTMDKLNVKCGLNLEVWDAVAFSQGDLEHLQVGDAGGEAREGLFAAPAHPHEKGVTARTFKDPVDTADVRHGVFEQHLIPEYSQHIKLNSLCHSSQIHAEKQILFT